MGNTKRRSFLRAGIASLPLGLIAQGGQSSMQTLPTLVPAGADRFGEHHILGVSSTDFKLGTGVRAAACSLWSIPVKRKAAPHVTYITTRTSGFM
jgi:hypothetical protein